MTIGDIKRWYGDVYKISTINGKIMFAGAILGEFGMIRDYQIMPGDVLEYVIDDTRTLVSSVL